jgi:peptide subunit release factor 1 (eRF1)
MISSTRDFSTTCADKNYVAIFTDDIEKNSNAESCIEEENLEEDVSDSLSELVDLIDEIQERYEKHGINLEIIIKQKPKE